MFRSAFDVADGLLTALNNYFLPAMEFVLTLMSNFLYQLESRWYFIFIWVLCNATFCIIVLGRSIFDWSDIVTDGLARGALLSHAKSKRLEENEILFQMRKNEQRIYSENEFNRRRELIDSDFQKRQEIIKNNYLSQKNNIDNVSFDIEKAEYKSRYGPINLKKRDE